MSKKNAGKSKVVVENQEGQRWEIGTGILQGEPQVVREEVAGQFIEDDLPVLAVDPQPVAFEELAVDPGPELAAAAKEFARQMERERIQNALKEMADEIKSSQRAVPQVKHEEPGIRISSNTVYSGSNFSANSSSWGAYSGNSPATPNFQNAPRPIQPRSNMDGGLERFPDCTGYWNQIEADGLNPLATRIIHIIYRERKMQYRYVDEMDDAYMPMDTLRKGNDIVYLFLWEPEEMM